MSAAFADHGPDGSGEPLAIMLRPGNAGSNTAADHWTAMFALHGKARRWEPKRLRLRLFSAAGRFVRGSRRLRPRISARWPWAPDITTAISRLDALSPPHLPLPEPASQEAAIGDVLAILIGDDARHEPTPGPAALAT